MKLEWGFLSLLVAVLMGSAGCEPGSSPSAEPVAAPNWVAQRRVLKLGDEAPAFQLRDLDGVIISLDQLRGRVVLVNFWATWCGPCKVEMPAMETLYRSFRRQDFEILAVSTDAQGAAVTRPFQQEMGFTFPILHDADFRIGLTYGARTLPMTFLIDRRGIIRHRIFGARDWQSPDALHLIQSMINVLEPCRSRFSTFPSLPRSRRDCCRSCPPVSFLWSRRTFPTSPDCRLSN
ncbi:MAG: redoxin domain-containing protein [Nitrospiraceae bacterium]